MLLAELRQRGPDVTGGRHAGSMLPATGQSFSYDQPAVVGQHLVSFVIS